MPVILESPVEVYSASARIKYRAHHYNFFNGLAKGDMSLAFAIHDRPVRKPFTVSGIYQQGDRWTWRISLLDDTLWDAFWNGAQQVTGLEIDGTLCPVHWENKRKIQRSYDELLNSIQPQNYITMNFVSPTVFKAGQLDYPLPEPRTVFRSWLSRWNDFAPPHRRINTELLEIVHTNVAIDTLKDIRTMRHDLGRGRPMIGFVGQVTFAVIKPRSLNQAHIWQMNALADYAEYCGTGSKTTQCMGQTRRVR